MESSEPRRLDRLIEAAREAERAGAWDEALARYEEAFGRVAQEGNAARAAELLRWVGTVHRERGDVELAADLYEASLAVAELNGLTQDTAAAKNCIALAHQIRGRLDAAESTYGEARTLAEAAGDLRLAAMIDQNLGTLANVRGDVEKALGRYESALRYFRGAGEDLAAAWALNNMGMASVDLGRLAEAEVHFTEAFRLADRACDAGTLGSVELNRAELYLKRGSHVEARESCDRAYEVFSRADSRSGQAEAHKLYGLVSRMAGKPHLAETHFRLAVELARQCEDLLLEAEARSEWALVHLDGGRNREALQALLGAHEIFSELQVRREVLDVERRLDRLEARFLRVVKQWGESIESKDRYTVGHCERVAEYSCRLAEAVGITGRDLKWFRMGAFLHDVGKTAVPADVLNKPGKLDPEEWAQMKRHTVVGGDIVTELNFPWDVRVIARNHHERWDGTGYPDGLRGEDIPLTARILTVADIYDALTTTRSYRPALSREDALRIMESESGATLDPTLFGIFKDLLAAGSLSGGRAAAVTRESAPRAAVA